MTNLNKISIEDLLNLEKGITIMMQAVVTSNNFAPEYFEPKEWQSIYSVLDLQFQIQNIIRDRISEYIPASEMDSEKIEGRK